MTPFVLPVTDSLNQMMTVSLPLDSGHRLLQVQLRHHTAPDLWFISLWDAAGGELLVNSIPVRVSAGAINDLLKPFRHRKPGSLFCLPREKTTNPTDPGKDNLSDYDLIWCEIPDQP